MATKKAKSKRPRKSKAERKSLIFWAEGAREDILRPHIAAYADALRQGWRQERDCLREICNEYHSLISWRLKDADEPALPLPDYDPKAPRVEEDLSDDEKALKAARIHEVNVRIRRWMKYRARKLCKSFQSTNPKKNPYAGLLAKLSGFTNPPKARQGYQQFMREQWREVIEPEVKTRWAKQILQETDSNRKAPGTGFRTSVAREMFCELPPTQQEAIKKRAQAEAQKAKKAYQEALDAPPSKSPVVRQRALEGLPAFLAPLLKGLGQITSHRFAVIYGGPNPKYNGEITTDVLTYGMSNSNNEMTWQQWDPARFDRTIEFFAEWLRSTYTDEDIKEAQRPLPPISDKDLYVFRDEDEDDDDPFGFDPYGENEEDEDAWSDLDEDDDGLTVDLLENAHLPRPGSKKRVRGPETEPTKPAKKRKANEEPSPTLDGSSEVAASRPRPRPFHQPKYSPYSPSDPDGPLIEPDWTVHEQVKAYNIARNARVLAPLAEEIQQEQASLFADLRRGRSSPSGTPPTPASPPASPPVSPPVSPSPVSPPAPLSTDVETADSQPSPPSPSAFAGHIEDDEQFGAHHSSPEAQDVEPSRPSTPVLIPASFVTRIPPLPIPAFLPIIPADQPPPQASRMRPLAEGNLQHSSSAHQPNSPHGSASTSLATPPEENSSSSSISTTSTLHSSPPQDAQASSPKHSQAVEVQVRDTNAPSSKPRSSRSRVIVMPLCPDTAEPWFREAYHGLTTVNLNDNDYRDLLTDYIALETAYNFAVAKSTKSLTATNRPAILNNWISGQRWRRRIQPEVDEPLTFAQSWWVWWSTLIPKWDAVTLNRKPKHHPENAAQWMSLRIPGPNGFLSPVVCLYWWRCALERHVHRTSLLSDWRAAVTEVRHILRGLIEMEDA